MKATDLRNHNGWDWKYFRIALVAGMLLLVILSVYYARNEYYEWDKLRNEVDLSLQKAAYLQNIGSFPEARDEYEGILDKISFSKFPDEYVIIQNNLGYIYQNLAQVQDKEANLKKAVKAYHESLKISTTEDYNIIDRAQTYNDLGDAYRDLAEIGDKRDYLEKAINAYHETLKMRPVDDYPIAYATVQNSLGIVYRMMAEEKDVEINLKKAFDAHYEALMVYSTEKYPAGYASTQNELGNAFRLLAEIKDEESNLENAIEAYHDALEIFTEEKNPEKYRAIMLNLENAKNQLNSTVRQK